MSSAFVYPDFYSFPPFFTIQPVLATREKQLAIWRELIVSFYTKKVKQSTLVVHDCPLWRNEEIQRSLNLQEIKQVVDSLVEHGQAEWQDSAKTRLRILALTPAQLATNIYQWAERTGHLGGGVCTVYELHSGEDKQPGVDEELVRRALAVLESQGRCAVFQGETSDEDGVKFS